ncbi:MAG TPA: tRNA epoxyqueuosine(34) reductase QueG [Candidatus Acidoferrales bacterium]|jgi:epoxyqueuosine reductase|nr:tRNA epoxyqueuosine(34) reductase QueG [Candidatus Acidoferrales bacterium]
MDLAARTRWICEQARGIGFELCGVAPAKAFPELAQVSAWLERGHAGEMNYLHDKRRGDPRRALDGARSLIVVALNYNAPQPYSTEQAALHDADSPRGWISRYAWGDDYHEVLREKLNALVARMHAHWPEPFDARAYVDTGPVVERVAAKYAGLGWLAKNTCLINEQIGSWLFLGVILTTLELEASLGPGEPPAADLCGNCTLCLDACPTQAFDAPYVLDARRCISYLTIELRGAIPQELRPAMGNAVIGCDICQDVCPWNRKSPVTQLAAFQPRRIEQGGENVKEKMENGATLFAPELEWFASLSQEEFSRIFRGSAVKRAKWRGLVRNACVAVGNSRIARGSETGARVAALLERLAASDDLLIAEHARWAMTRLGVPRDSAHRSD